MLQMWQNYMVFVFSITITLKLLLCVLFNRISDFHRLVPMQFRVIVRLHHQTGGVANDDQS